MFLLPLQACSTPERSQRVQAPQCGFPSPVGSPTAAGIPHALLPVEGSEVLESRPRDERLILSLAVPASVSDSFDAYKSSVRDAAFEILLQDFEGFEAELYLKRNRYLAVVEIRSSGCKDHSLVRLNLPGKEA